MAKGQYRYKWCTKILVLFFVILVPNSTQGKENPFSIDSWGVTQVKTIKLNYLWTIENFSLYNKTIGTFIESPILSSPKNNTFKWNLRMYPNGQTNSKGYIGIYLMYPSGPLPVVATNFNLSVLNTSRGKEKTNTFKNQIERGSGIGWSSVIKRDDVLNEANGFMANDSLSIYVEVLFQTEVISFSGNCHIRGESDLENQHSDHLMPLLESGNYSDAILVMQSLRFPVHKAILAARSPVFAALFVNNEKDPVVEVIDVDRDIIWEALRYIYTGRVQNLESIAKELLRVASVYEIQDLQAMCEESLCRNLSVDNAVAVIGLTERYNADKLRSKAIEFVAAHATQLINTDAFKALEYSRPDVIVELFNAMVKSGVEYSTLLSGVFRGLLFSAEKAPVSNST